MKPLLLLLISLYSYLSTFAQITQTVRGVVMDKESQFGIPGAAVKIISDSTLKLNANTDGNGNFKLQNVPQE